jgi:hypothetical protein
VPAKTRISFGFSTSTQMHWLLLSSPLPRTCRLCSRRSIAEGTDDALGVRKGQQVRECLHGSTVPVHASHYLQWHGTSCWLVSSAPPLVQCDCVRGNRGPITLGPMRQRDDSSCSSAEEARPVFISANHSRRLHFIIPTEGGAWNQTQGTSQAISN